MLCTFNQIFQLAKKKNNRKICVVNAHDDDVLKSVELAQKEGIASSILVGDKQKILKIANFHNIDISKFDIIDEKDNIKSAKTSIGLVREKSADILVKGKIQTPDLMKEVINKESGLRSNEILSHIGIIESPNYNKLLFITDGGLIINPDLNKKALIVKNAVNFLSLLGIVNPNIAGLAAIELLNADMQETIDASTLTMMNKRGQLKDCIFEGPLAFDNAINAEAAKIKGIESNIAGNVDVLLVPNISTGNILLKSIHYLGGAKCAGIVTGANCPIVLASRSDNFETKLNSIATAVAILD